MDKTEDKGEERRVLGRLDVSTIWKAVVSVSVFVWWESAEVGGVEGEERYREARAKRCRFWRRRMSQSTSSSRIRAVVRFWSTILRMVNHCRCQDMDIGCGTFEGRSCVFANFLGCLANAFCSLLVVGRLFR